MAYNANILLGRITKVQGLEGAVTVKLEKTFIENIPEMESVFLEIDGKPVPFFIENLSYAGSDILKIKFRWYDTYDRVHELSGCRIFLTAGERAEPERHILSFTGYRIYRTGNRLIGTISGIIENPGQYLFEILTPGKKELLIPFHEDLITKIDKRKKIIVMDLPDGLTELY